jgi:SAM-dependent methyltransferase
MPSSEPITVPRAAVPFILMQRTQHVAFLRSQRAMRLFLAADRLLGGDGRDVFGSRCFRPAVRLEGALRSRAIRRRYAMEIDAELGQLRPHLPARCRGILDVGCGVAGIDAALYRYYAADAPRLHLLDRTATAGRIYYGFHHAGAFYNSLHVARALLVANGVPTDRIHLIEAEPQFSIAPDSTVDLVVSLISWGFHYPVAAYLERVHALLAPGGRLILDVRGGTGGEAELRQRFQRVEPVAVHPRWSRLVAIKTG